MQEEGAYDSCFGAYEKGRLQQKQMLVVVVVVVVEIVLQK